MDFITWKAMVCSDDPEDRAEAADSLPDGMLANEVSVGQRDEIIAYLLKCLDDSEEIIRANAADTLGGFPDERVRKKLRKMARTDTSELSRAFAISSLGGTGAAVDIPYFLSLFASNISPQLRQHAALGLFYCVQRLVVEEILLPDLNIATVKDRIRAANILKEILESESEWFGHIREMLRKCSEQESFAGARTDLKNIIKEIDER